MLSFLFASVMLAQLHTCCRRTWRCSAVNSAKKTWPQFGTPHATKTVFQSEDFFWGPCSVFCGESRNYTWTSACIVQRRRNIIDLKRRTRRVLRASLNLVQQRWGKLDRHIYEIRPRADKHGFDLSSDTLPYSPMWYRGSNAIVDAVRYARSYSRPHPVVIRVYDPTGNIIETLEYKSDSKEF